MQRRKFIKDISLTAAGLAVSPYIFNSCSPKKKRNILFIMTDDHAFQAISSYGSKLNKTPNIDRLAKEGMLFEQSFVTNSICGPSRACMLTGKYNHINGMLDNSTTFDGSQQTFVKILKEHGYQTAIVGKWHLKSEPTGFDYWNILPGQGYYYNPDFIEMGEKKRIEGYVTDLTTDFALNWLDKRDKSDPFCLLLHHKAPHRNWMPGPEYLDKYDNEKLPLPETFYDDYNTRSESAKTQTMKIDEDMYIEYDLKVPISEDERDQFKNEKLDDQWWENIFSRMTEEQRIEWNKAYDDENEQFKKANLKGKELAEWKYQRYIKDYLRCVASVDDNVGRVLDYLKENNLDDNTLVVYTSDQGFYLGEHGWFDKRFMYEESHKTPLIIRAPNGSKGIVNKENMVVNIDYAPTFLDYAGVAIPNEMQGKSLRKILDGKNPADWRKAVYYHYFEYPAEHGVKRHYGIRTERYKLIHFYYDIDAWELYDLEKDPHEINNIYNNNEYQNIIVELKSELQKLREKYDDTDETKYLPKGNIKVDHKGIGATVIFEHPYASKYSGNNPNALFDGWRGPEELVSHVDFSVWQGFEKNDLIAKVDFGKEIEINKISAGFLHFLESWIFLPEFVEYAYSQDNRNFVNLGKVSRKGDIKSTKLLREMYEINANKIKTQYLKIIAKNIGLCPDWHQGFGKPAWLFADEVIIK
ncbi:MAG: sulfatase [Ignavibacteriales bacterium]|nr:sulfatase [Ignavibacteriales bacterium]